MKKTSEELENEIRKYTQKIKTLKAEREKQSKIEKAKQNVEILEALEEWRKVQSIPMEWNELADHFRREAQKGFGEYSPTNDTFDFNQRSSELDLQRSFE